MPISSHSAVGMTEAAAAAELEALEALDERAAEDTAQTSSQPVTGETASDAVLARPNSDMPAPSNTTGEHISLKQEPLHDQLHAHHHLQHLSFLQAANIEQSQDDHTTNKGVSTADEQDEVRSCGPNWSQQFPGYYAMGFQGFNSMPGMPGMPSVPTMPGMPGMPNMASMASMANMGMPNMPNMPNMSNMPSMAHMQGMAGMPTMSMPGMQSMAGMQNMQTMQTSNGVVTGMPLADFAQQWQAQQQQQAAMYWWWQMWMSSMYGGGGGMQAPFASQPGMQEMFQQAQSMMQSHPQYAWMQQMASMQQGPPQRYPTSEAPPAVQPVKQEAPPPNPTANTEPAPTPKRPREQEPSGTAPQSQSVPKRGRRAAKEQKVCKNCGTKSTPFWRKDKVDGRPLCNACGLYHSKNDTPRPKILWKAEDGPMPPGYFAAQPSDSGANGFLGSHASPVSSPTSHGMPVSSGNPALLADGTSALVDPPITLVAPAGAPGPLQIPAINPPGASPPLSGALPAGSTSQGLSTLSCQPPPAAGLQQSPPQGPAVPGLPLTHPASHVPPSQVTA